MKKFFKIFCVIVVTLLTAGPVLAHSGNGKGVPTEKFQWGPYEDIGVPFVPCGDFTIMFDWRGEGFWTTHYAKDGAPKFEFFLGRDTHMYWYNSEDPEIGYFSRGGKMNRHWFGEPFDSNRAEVGVLLKLVIPGEGIIFHEVGRVIYQWGTDEVLFSAGPHDLGVYWDEFDWFSLCPFFEE